MAKRKRQTVFVSNKKVKRKVLRNRDKRKRRVLRRRQTKNTQIKKWEKAYEVIKQLLTERGEMSVKELVKEVLKRVKISEPYAYVFIVGLRISGVLKERREGKHIYVRL